MGTKLKMLWIGMALVFALVLTLGLSAFVFALPNESFNLRKGSTFLTKYLPKFRYIFPAFNAFVNVTAGFQSARNWDSFGEGFLKAGATGAFIGSVAGGFTGYYAGMASGATVGTVAGAAATAAIGFAPGAIAGGVAGASIGSAAGLAVGAVTGAVAGAVAGADEKSIIINSANMFFICVIRFTKR